MPQQRLKIAYLSDFSPLDRNFYSGGNARIHDALVRHAGDVTILPQTWGLADPVRRAILALPDRFSLRLRWRAQLALAPVIACSIAAALRRDRYDVLFGAYAFQTLHHLRRPYPLTVAYTSDATPTVYRRSEIGQAFSEVLPGGRRLDGWVERAEALVLRGSDMLLWPSAWLRDATLQRYDLDPDKVHLVPWGANIAPPPVPQPRSVGPGAPLHLLLVGRNWQAKGGPVALATLHRLREAGLDARLTVIGSSPPEAQGDPHVTIHPQLDKSVPAEAALFQQLYARSHFVVQPSYESYGFAFCEASAHGVPSLCLRVGGVPVRDGVNGFALPPGSGAEAFAARIQAAVADPAGYAALCRSTRAEYDQHLNWDAWGARVGDLLRDAVARRRA
ncbi:MAG TPA: glycosyl transferase [Citreicella sp.]|mgnify:FL=1|nr:glycosyl transferase [Citreicella sp.]